VCATAIGAYYVCQVSAFDVESVKRRREISDCVAAGDVDRCALVSICSSQHCLQLAPAAAAALPQACCSIAERLRGVVADITGVQYCRAIALTEQLAPGTLEASPSVLLRLHIQIFIELVSRT
jgi:hypothetical protein